MYKFWCWLFWHDFYPIEDPPPANHVTVVCEKCGKSVWVQL